MLHWCVQTMSEKKSSSVLGPAIGLAAASLLAAQGADAATEVAQVADQRISLLLTLFVPVLGWVAFNILPGLKRQLDVSGSMGIGIMQPLCSSCVPGSQNWNVNHFTA